MQCNDLEIFLADYLEGDLDEARSAEFLVHLEECKTCREEVQAYRQQDERLTTFFRRELERVQSAPLPKIEMVGGDASARGKWGLRRIVELAAAACFVAVIGIGGWFGYRQIVPQGTQGLAQVKVLEGKAFLFSNGKYRALAVGDSVAQTERIKVMSDGYLALALAKDNVLEARGGTELALADFPNRLQIEMNRGQVWAHLTRKPEKRFVVTTAHLAATAVGTVFGVQEGLDRTQVAVAEGKVLLSSGGGGAITVAAGEARTSFGPKDEEVLAEATAWSRYPKNLASLMVAREKGAARAPIRVAQISVPEAAPEAPTTAPLITSSAPLPVVAAQPQEISDLLDLLPDGTMWFLSFEDWQQILGEFKDSDYARFVNEPQLKQWWEMVRGEKEYAEFLSETHFKDILGVAQLLEGQAVAALVGNGKILFIADCGRNQQEIVRLVRAAFQDGSGVYRDPEKVTNGGLRFYGGKIILGNAADVQMVVERMAKGEKSGFRDSEFVRTVMRNVDDKRLVLAGDLRRVVAGMMSALQQNPDVRALADFWGATSLDYLVAAPSFAGRGMNQAARIGFLGGGRKGVMNWLAEPAPLRSPDFFSPDVNIFAAAVVRSPEDLIVDYLYLQKQSQGGSYESRADVFAHYDSITSSLGHEIAVGIDNPILPIPNIKIAAEVVDPERIQQGIDTLVQELIASLGRQQRYAYQDEIDHRGFAIRSLVVEGWLVSPSWAIVDGFLIMGPGPEFVKHSIEVHESGPAITRDRHLTGLLPGGASSEFSMLVYQDVAKTIPKLLESKLGPALGERNPVVPSLTFMERYRAPGIAYFYAHDDCIDLHLNAPSGIDLNLGMAAPLVANWVLPHQARIGQQIQKVAEARVALTQLQEAVARFENENGRLPKDLVEVAKPEGRYIDRLPLDPFGQIENDSLRMRKGPGEDQITIYSIGPDGADDNGLAEYDLGKDPEGKGDIILRIPPDGAGGDDGDGGPSGDER